MSTARETYLRGIAAGVRRAPTEQVGDVDDDISQPEEDEAAFAASRALDEMHAAAQAAPVDAPSLSMPQAVPVQLLASEIPNVADTAWTQFAKVMKTAKPDAISASNAYGMFELKPRRLADFGLIKNTFNTRAPNKRMVWIGEWVAPMTQAKFLASPKDQYRVFAASMKDYAKRLRDGTIPKPDGGRPDGMTLSGALAILHRCGPSGLKTWNDVDNRFSETVDLYSRSNGIF